MLVHNNPYEYETRANDKGNRRLLNIIYGTSKENSLMRNEHAKTTYIRIQKKRRENDT